jgi:hypothetical protein
VAADSRFSNVNSIIFVSYNMGIKYDVTAEWAEDKLRVIQALGIKTVVVTSGASRNLGIINRDVFTKVWPIGFQDMSHQIQSSKAQADKSQDKPTILDLIISSSLGRVWDLVFKFFAGGVGSGRYSWILTSVPVIAIHALRNRGSIIFSTGGPTGAHVAASIAASLTRKQHYLEAQDPIFGTEMRLSSLGARALAFLEGWLIANSKKTVLVTKTAAESTRCRHPKNAAKVCGIYPGAWRHKTNSVPKRVSGAFRFLHTGTLYGTRNLDAFFLALDELYVECPELIGQIEVAQKGGLFCDNRDSYLSRADFKLLSLGTRVETLNEALNADALLLVQHFDSRSRETVPYKFYDYLNLGSPILALHNSSELEELCLLANGFPARNSDTSEVKKSITKILSKVQSGAWEKSTQGLKIDMFDQFSKLLADDYRGF